MNPKNHVSIALAHQLKDFGFPQTCGVCWDLFGDLEQVFTGLALPPLLNAPTVSELFEALPIPSGGHVPFLYTGISRTHVDGAEKYFCMVAKWKSFTADTMPDAVAKAIIALVKAGKLTLHANAGSANQS